MDINFSDEQLAIQKLARDFTRQEIEPVAERIDREGRLPDDLIKKLAKLGLLGMTVPREYGGSVGGR